jgi:hypothetical protein
MEKLPHETKSMFERRKNVYEIALNQGYSSKDAVKYANIWANVCYMGCRYSQNLMETAKKLGEGV